MTAGSPVCSHCDQLRVQLAEKDIVIAALRSQIETLGRNDSATGALNCRTFLEMLQVELQRAQRTGHPFCVAVLGLDQFPAIGDEHGQVVGDAVLRKTAETAIKLLRTIDRFGRLEGDIFGIILPATWLDQGMIAMNRLAKAIAGCDVSESVPGLSLTFSAGITTNAFGDTPESMILRAEQSMQQARAAGGNHTIQAEEPLPEMPVVT